MLGYDLPKKSCTLPGQVLKHCYAVVDKILESQYPCIYKVGFTHCAYFRLHNTKFGYKHERDLWQKMIVIYAASEPVSPGFVEAAIIQRHKGFLIAFTLGKDQCHATIMQATFHDIVVYLWSGEWPGSYNVYKFHNVTKPSSFRTKRLPKHSGWWWNHRCWQVWALFGLHHLPIVPDTATLQVMTCYTDGEKINWVLWYIAPLQITFFRWDYIFICSGLATCPAHISSKATARGCHGEEWCAFTASGIQQYNSCKTYSYIICDLCLCFLTGGHACNYIYLGSIGSSSQVLSPDSIGVTLQDSLHPEYVDHIFQFIYLPSQKVQLTNI